MSEKPAAAEAIAACLRKFLRVFFMVFEVECLFPFTHTVSPPNERVHLVLNLRFRFGLKERKYQKRPGNIQSSERIFPDFARISPGFRMDLRQDEDGFNRYGMGSVSDQSLDQKAC
jgi:hypothetical protein